MCINLRSTKQQTTPPPLNFLLPESKLPMLFVFCTHSPPMLPSSRNAHENIFMSFSHRINIYWIIIQFQLVSQGEEVEFQVNYFNATISELHLVISLALFVLLLLSRVAFQSTMSCVHDKDAETSLEALLPPSAPTSSSDMILFSTTLEDGNGSKLKRSFDDLQAACFLRFY